MINYFNLPDNCWGPWEAAQDVPVKIGDIIRLDINGDCPNERFRNIYKIEKMPSGRFRETRLSFLCDQDNLEWNPGYSWTLNHPSKIKLLLNNKTNQINTSGCICHKCKSLNIYAEANQKDGTYICFECR